MAASDLAVLADVKTWLSGSSGIGSSDDALLGRLITDVSGAITAYLGRPSLTPRPVAERLDGNGKARMFLRHYPALQLTSLAIDNVAVPAAVTPAAGAPFSKGYLLEAWDGLPPGRPQALDLFHVNFRRGPAERGDQLHRRLCGRRRKRHGAGRARPLHGDSSGAVRALGERRRRRI